MSNTTEPEPKPRPRRRYRDYTQADRAAALAALTSGSSLAEAAASVQAPRPTVHSWMQDQDLAAVGNHTTSDEAADLWRDMELTSLRAAKGKHQDASFLQLVTAAGISFDKRRLIEGLPTSIVQGDASAAMVALGTALGTALGRRIDARERAQEVTVATESAPEPLPVIEAEFVESLPDARHAAPEPPDE